MSKFNKIFIYTSVICTSTPFLILALTKFQIITIPIILTSILAICVFYLIDKIHPIILLGRFNLSKFIKNIFIFLSTLFLLLFTSLFIELLLKDKELLDKLSKIKDLGANIATGILTISLIVWGMKLVSMRIINKKHYRKCTIKSEIEVETSNIGDCLVFDVELDTPIDKENHFKFLTKQLELKEVLKENQKVIINGFLSTTTVEQEDDSMQVYKSINGEIVNKDFIIKHKINFIINEFKNFKSKGANK